MNERQLQNLRRFLDQEAADLGVRAVYLFGSRAEGRAHRESDVDLAVLLDWDRYPERRGRSDLRLELIAEFSSLLGENDIDLVVLNDAPPLFGRKIIYDGKRIWVGDDEADRCYVRDVQLRAADIEPWVKKMRALKLELLRAS